jgi:hypothetical protein
MNAITQQLKTVRFAICCLALLAVLMTSCASTDRIAGGSRLPPCPSSGHKDNCFGEVIDSGDRYVGEFKDNKASGIGTITTPDGRRYVGEFKDDEIHGTGTMTFPDGATHVGRWVKGFAEGQGTYTSASGEKYVGEFKGSKRNGQGTLTWPDGGRYIGEFSDGRMSGSGAYAWPDGHQYVGDFKDDMRNGRGTYTYPDGRKYVGEFQNNQLTGHGTLTLPDGRKHVGTFNAGKRDGRGIEYNADGSIRFSGVWRNEAYIGTAPTPAPPTPIARAPAPPPPSQAAPKPPVVAVAPPPAIKRTGPSLVSTGTGFFVNTGGYLLTNNHVVEGCKQLVARSNKGQVFDVEFVASDTRNDLALLRSTVTGIAAPFRDGVAPLGEAITVFGFPLAGTLTVTGNLTTGSISALAGLGSDSSKYQVSAPIQPGNSGGAVLDESGLVVGVVQSSLNAGRLFNIAGDLPQNVNFAIKASIAQRFLQTHRVAYIEQPPTTTARKASAIAEDAVQFTVLVACFK